jgi:hypothetical protein
MWFQLILVIAAEIFLVATIRISPIATDIYPVATMVVTEILSGCKCDMH